MAPCSPVRFYAMEECLLMKKLFCLLLFFVLMPFLPPAARTEAADAPEPIDLDLSVMSGTVAYAQVCQMMYEPEAYIGKIIRVTGFLDVFEDRDTGMVYTSCVIPDAAACCLQGIEFVWAGDHPWPEAYPGLGAYLTVTGRFETYLEDDWMYVRLADAEVEWL